MSSETKPRFDYGPAAADAASPSVQELISQLRSTFFSTDFQNVAKILMDREEKMKKQYVELGNRAEYVEKEKEYLVLENLKLKEDLEKKQKELDAIRKLNFEYKDEIRVLNVEKCKASKTLIREDELKLERKMNVEYERKISVLQSDKCRLEAELRAYKEELESRVSSLEKKSEMLMASEGALPMKTKILQPKNECVAESSKTQLLDEEGDSIKVMKPKSPWIMHIDDDDDDDGDDDDHEPISTMKMKRVSSGSNGGDDDDDQELDHQPKAFNLFSTPNLKKFEVNNVRSSLDSSNSSFDSDDDDDDDDTDEAYKSIIARIRMRKR